MQFLIAKIFSINKLIFYTDEKLIDPQGGLLTHYNLVLMSVWQGISD